MSPLASRFSNLNDAFSEPATPFWLTLSTTPHAEVIFVTRFIRISSPKVLCAENKSATIGSVSKRLHTAMPFLFKVSALICSPVFTSAVELVCGCLHTQQPTYRQFRPRQVRPLHTFADSRLQHHRLWQR